MKFTRVKSSLYQLNIYLLPNSKLNHSLAARWLKSKMIVNLTVTPYFLAFLALKVANPAKAHEPSLSRLKWAQNNLDQNIVKYGVTIKVGKRYCCYFESGCGQINHLRLIRSLCSTNIIILVSLKSSHDRKWHWISFIWLKTCCSEKVKS